MSVETALLAAFTGHLGAVKVHAYETTPWSSATFSGGRHVFRVETDDKADIQAFARDITDADIPIPRGFVADVAVTNQQSDDPRRITIEALTIDA